MNADTIGASTDPPKILVIEDSALVRQLLEQALSPDYRVECATDGAEGLRCALGSPPDLILLDLGLPKLSGRELLHLLRSRRELQTVPVLVVTGLDDGQRNVQLLERGAQDLLLKPFSLIELKLRVRNLIATKKTVDLLNSTIGRQETDLLQLAARVAEQQHDLEATLDRLDQARQTAEEANRIKGNFLRMMSHEIKTPVAALQLHSRLIQMGAQACHSPEIDDGVVRIERSARRLLHLVDTFLEWARADQSRSKLSIEEVDLQALAQEVAQEQRGYADQKGLTIHVRAPGRAVTPLLTDPKIIRILMVHLVHRALQTTRRGSIEVWLESSGSSYSVCVKDGAAPLNEEQMQQVLGALPDPSDLGSRAGSGSGLGLRIAGDIARAVSGVLQGELGASGGNVWRLTLPALRPRATPAPSQQVVSSPR